MTPAAKATRMVRSVPDIASSGVRHVGEGSVVHLASDCRRASCRTLLGASARAVAPGAEHMKRPGRDPRVPVSGCQGGGDRSALPVAPARRRQEQATCDEGSQADEGDAPSAATGRRSDTTDRIGGRSRVSWRCGLSQDATAGRGVAVSTAMLPLGAGVVSAFQRPNRNFDGEVICQVNYIP